MCTPAAAAAAAAAVHHPTASLPWVLATEDFSPNRFQLNRRIGDIARVETYLSRLKRAQELLLKHLLHENVQNI